MGKSRNHFYAAPHWISPMGDDLDCSSFPFLALAEFERDLLVSVSAGEREALYGAARLYEDALGLITPPIHNAAEIKDAKRWLGERRLKQEWRVETAVSLCHMATGLPTDVCAAYLDYELEVDIANGMVWNVPAE